MSLPFIGSCRGDLCTGDNKECLERGVKTLLALCDPDQAVSTCKGDTLRVLKVSRIGDILVVIFSMHQGSWLVKGESHNCRTKLAQQLSSRRPDPCLTQHFAAFFRLSSRPTHRICPRSYRELPSVFTLRIQAQRKPISSGPQPRYWIRPCHGLPPTQRYCSITTQSHEASFEQPYKRLRNSASLPILAAR